MDAHGKFCWNELNTWNLEKAKQFYGETIGWTFEDTPLAGGGTYTIIMEGETRVGGIFTLTSPEFDGADNMWMPYLAVDDVDNRVKKAVASGAKLFRPPFDIPGIGRMAVLLDGAGACIAWMTPIIPA